MVPAEFVLAENEPDGAARPTAAFATGACVA